MKMEYGVARWREGHSFRVAAPIAKLELDKIRKANKGRIAAMDVVKAAKGKTNALHSCFEWNVKKAANEHWLETARLILRSIVVVREDAPDCPMRAYETVRLESEEGAPQNKFVYMETEDILRDPEARKGLLDRAISEAESYKQRYQHLEELSSIIDAIGRTTKRFGKKPGLPLAI